jgi:methylthioribose-1-phosphate isomerase
MNTQQTEAPADNVRAVQWTDGRLKILDQRLLPARVDYLVLSTVEEVAAAIRDMAVRGAPAIGIAAAYGAVLGAARAWERQPDTWRREFQRQLPLLLAARPTAVNLRWALDRMQAAAERCQAYPVDALLREATAIHQEDTAANHAMGRIGAEYLRNSRAVLTHCNTGSLATGGFGTALGVIRTAYSQYLIDTVYASETRPWLQGSRLTAWELQQDRIPVTLVADSAAAWLMQSGRVGWVIVGADRIAANGDVANKIGTYAHAVNARHHGLGFMVVAPVSTIDAATADGKAIEIEERKSSELLEYAGIRLAPAEAQAYNPVFDITPGHLVTVLVTEKGAVEAPDAEKIRRLLR